MKFWDREKEKAWLKRYLQTEPNAILFVYGPKSSGKSTLMYQVVKELSRRKRFVKRYDVYWYDLRGIMIRSYGDIVDIFFDPESKEGQKVIRDAEVYLGIPNIAGFRVGKKVYEELRGREIDPFRYMEAVLMRSGKRHIVVFDELQKLKDVYLNGDSKQRPLVKELFNFFVRLTKVLHLAHVIVMTSDTFFIEEVYTDSTLKNTSRFYLVDFFDDDTAVKILVEEGLDEGTAKEIVRQAGGVPWIMEEVVEGDSPMETLKEIYEQYSSRLYEAVRNREDLKKLLKRAIEGENLYYADRDIEAVKELVDNEVLFYDPIGKDVRFQTRLDERAVRELLNL